MRRSTHNDKELEGLHVRLFHLEHFSHHESSSILRRRETVILNKILHFEIPNMAIIVTRQLTLTII